MLHYLRYANSHRTNVELISVLWQTVLLLPGCFRTEAETDAMGTRQLLLMNSTYMVSYFWDHVQVFMYSILLWVWGFTAKIMTEQEMVNTYSPSWLLGFYWHWAVTSVTQPVDARYSHQLDSIPFECNTFRLPVFPFAFDWGLLPPSGFNCRVCWAIKNLGYLSRPGAFFFQTSLCTTYPCELVEKVKQWLSSLCQL